MTLAAVIALALAVLAGWVLPAFAVRALVRTLADGPLLVANYRGRRIPPVLGLGWLVWALGLLAVQAGLDACARADWASEQIATLAERVGSTPLALPFFVVPFILVAGSTALGLADDAFGAGGPKGFAGHLSALRHGRLTTGMLKMAGIGLLAAFYAADAAPDVLERSVVAGTHLAGAGWHLLAWALAALVIALSANLLNLLDLRPGRALKAYAVLVPVPAVAFALSSVTAYNADAAAYAPSLALTTAETAVTAAALVLVVLGPALAAWPADLGERAMLGDAGSNAAGALLGYLLSTTLDLARLAVATLVLVALNLASERVSFSAVIDRVAVLRFIDRIGRRGSHGEPEAAQDAPPPDGGVRYHSDVDHRTEED
jgi:hypothetical protein